MNVNPHMPRISVDSPTHQEFWDTVRRQAHSYPEQDLLLAVLKDALLSFRNNRRRASKEALRKYHADRAWFFAHDTDRLFAFESVCDALGLSPQRIRQQLISWEQRA
jgi:hypothetical protein